MKPCKLLNSIHFMPNRITSCFSRIWENEENVGKYFIRADNNTTPEVLNSFFDLRNQYKQMYKDGKIPDFCKCCQFYEPEEDCDGTNNQFFDFLFLAYRDTCHCKCIYCCVAGENNTEEDFMKMNNRLYYNIKPMFKYLDEHHLINHNTKISFGAGELTDYPEEAHFLMDIGIKNSCVFNILTNGIKYDDYIARLMENYTAEIVISLDSGSKEMYKKIKRVNAFDKVKENIMKYSKAGKNNPKSNILLKYIFCPGINDNIEEIKKFKKLAKEADISSVILSIDRFWMEHNIDKPVPLTLKEAMNFFVSKKDFPTVCAGIDYGFVNKDWADKVFRDTNA